MAFGQRSLRRMFILQMILGFVFLTILFYLVNNNKQIRTIAIKLSGLQEPLTFIRFDPAPNVAVSNSSTYDNVKEFPCRKRISLSPYDVEDLMCLERPDYLPMYKTPCFYEGFTLKCVPYYLIIGFEKCGTTDFYMRLKAHPAILANPGDAGKETRYWSWDRYGLYARRSSNRSTEGRSTKLFASYIEMFHLAASIIQRYSSQEYQPIVGDATPADIWQSRGWPHDPQNFNETEPRVLIPHLMRHMFKDPKFFIFMRDPVERLFSDYLFVGDGEFAKDFDRDVPRAIEIFNSCLRTNSTRQCFYSDEMHSRVPMRLYIGCYSIYLRDWFSVFQRKHFFITRTEDYERDSAGTLRAAFSFLEIDTLTETALAKIASHPKRHATGRKTVSGLMSSHTRQLLEDFYAPCNQDLAKLLGDSKFLWQDITRNDNARDRVQDSLRNRSVDTPNYVKVNVKSYLKDDLKHRQMESLRDRLAERMRKFGTGNEKKEQTDEIDVNTQYRKRMRDSLRGGVLDHSLESKAGGILNATDSTREKNKPSMEARNNTEYLDR